MTLFLSGPEFISQCSQYQEKYPVQKVWTIPLHYPKRKSSGYRQWFDLRPGLGLLIDDYTLHDDLIVETGTGETFEPWLCFELSFMLSGNNRTEGVRSHENFLVAEWTEKNGGQFYWQAERVLKFDIHVAPDLFNTLINHQFEALSPALIQVFQDPKPTHYFWQVNSTTAAMRSAIHQILSCPYQELTRWLYLESKPLELIALRLEQVSEHSICSTQ